MAYSYVNRLLDPRDVILSRWGFRKPRRPVLNPHHPINRNLRGCWLLGDYTDGLVPDISVFHNTGKFTGGPVSLFPEPGNGRTGQANHHGGFATQFNSLAVIDCGNPGSLDITGNGLTLCCWVNGRGGTFPRLISKEASPENGGYMLITYSLSSNPNFSVWNVGSQASIDASRQTNAFNWTFVAGTYDGATVKIYLDGVLQGSAATAIGPITSSAVNLTIGATPRNTNNVSDAMDGVRVYARALDAGEIYQLYSEPYAGIWDAEFLNIVKGVGFPPPTLVDVNSPLYPPLLRKPTIRQPISYDVPAKLEPGRLQHEQTETKLRRPPLLWQYNDWREPVIQPAQPIINYGPILDAQPTKKVALPVFKPDYSEFFPPFIPNFRIAVPRVTLPSVRIANVGQAVMKTPEMPLGVKSLTIYDAERVETTLPEQTTGETPRKP